MTEPRGIKDTDWSMVLQLFHLFLRWNISNEQNGTCITWTCHSEFWKTNRSWWFKHGLNILSFIQSIQCFSSNMASVNHSLYGCSSKCQVVDIFSKMRKTKKTYSASSDGIIPFSSWRTNRRWYRNTWYHTDQSYLRPILNVYSIGLLPMTLIRGYATFMESSNIYQEEFAQKFEIKNKSDW